MSYEILATGTTPALVIYLLDVSASMNQVLGGKRRMDVVIEALTAALRQMVFRSTKGSRISPRYRIGMLAYSDHVYDLLDGIKTVEQVAHLGVPELGPMNMTETARAFAQVERIVQAELPSLERCPAPLICHMTDGEFTGPDPEPIARRIRALQVPDGAVLIENIFIAESLLSEPIGDVHRWPGIMADTPLRNPYAQKLLHMSSPMPDSYRMAMLEYGYHTAPGALMLLPGLSPELVSMGFQLSAATPVR